MDYCVCPQLLTSQQQTNTQVAQCQLMRGLWKQNATIAEVEHMVLHHNHTIIKKNLK
jgi:hypothetical protein